MALIASLVLSHNGAATLGGISAPLSTEADRERFLKRHRSAAAFIIGKRSALIESYGASQVPIFVFSRETTPLDLPHPLMQQITVDRNIGEISRLIDLRIEGDIVIEGGPTLLMALINANAVDTLELSISPISGDGDYLNIESLLAHFDIENEIEIDGTRLLQCRYKSNSANS